MVGSLLGLIIANKFDIVKDVYPEEELAASDAQNGQN